MATTPEGWVKKAVKELLAYWDVYYHMPVQNGMGKPSLDFICCVRGRFVAIETKAPGNEMTPRQARTTEEIESAEGVVFVIGDWPAFQGLWRSIALPPDREAMPPGLQAKWERYFRNAGCNDVEQRPA